jgi:hypothetical protein
MVHPWCLFIDAKKMEILKKWARNLFTLCVFRVAYPVKGAFGAAIGVYEVAKGFPGRLKGYSQPLAAKTLRAELQNAKVFSE